MFRRAMRWGWMAGLAAAAVLDAGAPARAESLDRVLLDRAPQVLEFLRKQGCHTVGVLKFCVWDGKGEGTEDGTGAVNLDVAQHLRNALILSEDARKEDEEIKVIRDANAVAAGLEGRPNHLTREGRLKLLAADYPLVWPAGRTARPDGFLTGNVHFSDDLRNVTIVLQYIDKEGRLEGVFDPKNPILAAADGGALAGLGMSFLLREAEVGGDGGLKTVPEGAAAASAQAVRDKKQDFPLDDRADPVQLVVEYGGRPQPLQIEKNGRASIPEPRNGEKVRFRLSRAPGAHGTYGVVLLVNGENTLFKERRSTDYGAYSLRILRPDADPVTVAGFQMDDKTDHPFDVQPVRASGEDEIRYGENLGKITLVVFPEKQHGDTAKADPDLKAVRQDGLPPDGVENARVAQIRLRDLKLESRGIITEGTDVGASPIRFVDDFVPAPKPLMTVVITYYHPKQP